VTQLTASSTPTTQYTYGWHRAEILAALVNGVFLLALCFTITLEALERFFSTPGAPSISLGLIHTYSVTDISNPKLIVVVGSLGLISNLIGLSLFRGQSYVVAGLSLADCITEHAHAHDHSHHSAKSSKAPSIRSATFESVPRVASPVAVRQARPPAHHGGSYSSSSLYGHPAATRASFVQTANDIARGSSPAPADRTHKHRTRSSIDLWTQDSVIISSPPYGREEHETPRTEVQAAISASAPHEQTSLLQQPPVIYSTSAISTSVNLSSPGHAAHGHSHSHSHGGSMNMRALVLHVLGDALGNVGVIATGLIIWLTSWSFKYYCDPIISLIITAIICHSALPLGDFSAFHCFTLS
jgi:zinc transporter 1